MAKNRKKKAGIKAKSSKKTMKKAVKIRTSNSKAAELPVGAVILKPGNSILTKTGNWRSIRPVRDESKCIYCGICWQYCPDIAIDKDINTNYDYCKGCGICANVCPTKCIKMEKEEK